MRVAAFIVVKNANPVLASDVGRSVGLPGIAVDVLLLDRVIVAIKTLLIIFNGVGLRGTLCNRSTGGGETSC